MYNSTNSFQAASASHANTERRPRGGFRVRLRLLHRCRDRLLAVLLLRGLLWWIRVGLGEGGQREGGGLLRGAAHQDRNEV